MTCSSTIQNENRSAVLSAVPSAAVASAGIGGDRYSMRNIMCSRPRRSIRPCSGWMGCCCRPADLPDAPVVFVEAQMQGDEEFYGRLFAEMFLYLYLCRAKPQRRWRTGLLGRVVFLKIRGGKLAEDLVCLGWKCIAVKRIG